MLFCMPKELIFDKKTEKNWERHLAVSNFTFLLLFWLWKQESCSTAMMFFVFAPIELKIVEHITFSVFGLVL
jgi:hypothetical protein